MGTTASRSVSNPNKSTSSSFLWVILAVLAIAALVIGLVFFNNQGKRFDFLADRDNVEVSASMMVDDDDHAITLAADDAAKDAESVELYEDFSCSHCADLAVATDDRMLEEVEDGNLVVSVHPLNFLDRGAEGHSTAAVAAILAIAHHDSVDTYWNFRDALFEYQEDVTNQWDNEDFAEAAKAIGANDETVDAIASGMHLDDAKQWSDANAKRLEEQTGSVSSPRIIQDGKDVEVPNGDINQWVDAVVKN